MKDFNKLEFFGKHLHHPTQVHWHMKILATFHGHTSCICCSPSCPACMTHHYKARSHPVGCWLGEGQAAMLRKG